MYKRSKLSYGMKSKAYNIPFHSELSGPLQTKADDHGDCSQKLASCMEACQLQDAQGCIVC